MYERSKKNQFFWIFHIFNNLYLNFSSWGCLKSSIVLTNTIILYYYNNDLQWYKIIKIIFTHFLTSFDKSIKSREY